ncbi:MAG: uracil-DNA glycosylase [Verrucomicrobia bacterium]|nr:MAG: uracil-DNA glycosylase [Verrucomicrobiota bacterium]
MLQPALSLVLEALEKIRDSQEKPPRVSRAILNRLFEQAASPAAGEAGVHAAPKPAEGGSSARKTDIAAKAAALAQVRERVCVCMKCPHLANTRTQTVFGVGNPDAELMFVGEAPGADEDARGEPFVGRAGQLLTRIIETMGLSRDEVYIANILKCRPDMPKSASGNRPPTPEEMSTCIGYLIEQIEIIQPRVVVALGATAVEGLLGARGVMRELRGKWHSYHDTPLMITYHPSYLLRNQSPGEKRKVWEDMMAVLEKIDCPISERQRNYFL